MNKLLTRGGIEIIAVFIGISGGLWSEKQIELKKTLKAEKIALSSIRDEFVSDSTSLSSIVSSIENEQKEISVFLKHISGDTSLSDEKLNSLIFEMIYFAYLTYDKSVYESLIKGAGKKIIQKDSVSSAISSIYESTYEHLGNMFDIQKEQLATRTYDAFIESGGYLDTKRFSISESLKLSQREMFSEVLKNKKFVTQVSFHHDTNYFILNQYKWALKEVQGAIGIIENYLENS
ncbi:MAG: hypothetical protein VW963_10170 [Candidatus Neomarinimicrobiota bacterium]